MLRRVEITDEGTNGNGREEGTKENNRINRQQPDKDTEMEYNSFVR